MKSKAI